MTAGGMIPHSLRDQDAGVQGEALTPRPIGQLHRARRWHELAPTSSAIAAAVRPGGSDAVGRDLAASTLSCAST